MNCHIIFLKQILFFLHEQKFYKRFPSKFEPASVFIEFPWPFFYKEIVCKMFLTFQTWSGFFPPFVEENQRTRKIGTFIFSELQLCKFSAKLKKLFCSSFIIIMKSLCATRQGKSPLANPYKLCSAVTWKYKNITRHKV